MTTTAQERTHVNAYIDVDVRRGLDILRAGSDRQLVHFGRQDRAFLGSESALTRTFPFPPDLGCP